MYPRLVALILYLGLLLVLVPLPVYGLRFLARRYWAGFRDTRNENALLSLLAGVIGLVLVLAGLGTRTDNLLLLATPFLAGWAAMVLWRQYRDSAGPRDGLVDLKRLAMLVWWMVAAGLVMVIPTGILAWVMA